MKQQRRLDMFFYGLADFLTAMLAWACFYIYRKNVEGAVVDATIFQDEDTVLFTSTNVKKDVKSFKNDVKLCIIDPNSPHKQKIL